MPAERIDVWVEEVAGTPFLSPTCEEPAAEDDLRLKGTRHLWLWKAKRVPEWRRAEFDWVKAAQLQTSRA